MPRPMVRILLRAMDEVMGPRGVDSVLQRASMEALRTEDVAAASDRGVSFESISLIMRTLEDVHGQPSGRGLALRIGRACLKYGLKAYGFTPPGAESTFRLLPLSEKLRAGAAALAGFLNRHSDMHIAVEDHGHQILWRIERCPLCRGREADDPVCLLAVGFIQESLEWASGGRPFYVQEQGCIAAGDAACAILVHTMPAD